MRDRRCRGGDGSPDRGEINGRLNHRHEITRHLVGLSVDSVCMVGTSFSRRQGEGLHHLKVSQKYVGMIDRHGLGPGTDHVINLFLHIALKLSREIRDVFSCRTILVGRVP